MKKTAVYLKHLFPAFTSLLIFALTWVPGFHFAVNGEVYETTSLMKLIGNSWNGFLQYLSAGSFDDKSTKTFYFLTGIFAALAFLLLVLSLCLWLFGACCALLRFSDKVPTATRNTAAEVYVRVFFSRGAFLFALFLPILPTLFPRLLTLFYMDIAGFSAAAVISDGLDLLVISIISTALAFILTLYANQYEDDLGMSVSRKL